MKYLKITVDGRAIYATDIAPAVGDSSFVEIPAMFESEPVNTLYYKSAVVKKMPSPPAIIGYFWDYDSEVWIDASTITLTLTPVLNLTGRKDDYSVIDTNLAEDYGVEIYDSLINDRSSSLLKTGNYKPNEKRYVWARYIDSNGSYSAWHRADTNGQLVTIDPITSANTANSLISVTPTTGNFTGFSPAVSANNTWYTVGYTEFTAQTDDYIHLTPIVVYEISAVTNSATPASDILAVYLRSYLVDVTDAGAPFVVEGSLRVLKPFKLIGTKQFGGLARSDAMPETHLTGFRGLLSPGRTYRYTTDIAKVIEGGGASCTVSLYQYSPVVSFSRFS